MKARTVLLLFLLGMLHFSAYSKKTILDTDKLPLEIYSGKQGKFHVQGAVVDLKQGFVYFSFTTKLIKTDLNGKLIGSVDGLTGHLGCLTQHPGNGKIYGSLEYKNDNIGKGIRKELGKETEKTDKSGFYIAIFDVDKITRPNMDAEKDGIVTTVYLKTVVDDYYAKVTNNGKEREHRYGCSGIDGVTFAPRMGKKGNGEEMMLYVAYGIYGDKDRTDNDYQVLLTYEIEKWGKYESPLSQQKKQLSGPKKPDARYFLYTGNTNYGIQNLTFDPFSKNIYAAVYKGAKTQYPNYSLFVINTQIPPRKEKLKGINQKGMVLSLLEAGKKDPATSIRGWDFPWGSTGMSAIGDGYFYISHNGITPKDKQQYTRLILYKWIGNEQVAFELCR